MQRERMRKLGLVVLSVLILTTMPVLAEVIEINAPTDDSFVRGGSYSSDNYGTADSLVAKNTQNLGYARKSYLKFDTSSITKTVTSATLELVAKYNTGGTNRYDIELKFYGLNDGAAGETTWAEGTITWDNAPGNTDTPSDFENATLLGTITVPGNTPAGSTISFSSAGLVNFLNADSNNTVTIMISSGSQVNGDVYFASKEHKTYAAPKLSVTLVPEPATIGLLVLGCGLLSRR